jgi:hypothetical protein
VVPAGVMFWVVRTFTRHPTHEISDDIRLANGHLRR